MTQQQRLHPSTSRSTTTFSAGTTLTISKNQSCTVITRHPRSVSLRRAEIRAKSLLSDLSDTAYIPPLTTPCQTFTKAIFLTFSLLPPLLPIALHILHHNEIITILTHIPAALLTLVIIHLLTKFPHTSYLAITTTHLIYRPRGLLSNLQIHPLSIIRSFTHQDNRIIAQTLSPNIYLKAPDKQTASAAVQALNTALITRDRTNPPPILLDQPGQLIVTLTTPLYDAHLPPEKLRIITKGDRVKITTKPSKFPKITLVFIAFLVTHAISTLLLLFIYNDLPRTLQPLTTAMICVIALAAFYLTLVLSSFICYFITCIPKSWKLLVVGCRKDVHPGMIDVAKCRHVLLQRSNKAFGVTIVSNTGYRFLNVSRLSEAEASKLVSTLRFYFPMLFRDTA